MYAKAWMPSSEGDLFQVSEYCARAVLSQVAQLSDELAVPRWKYCSQKTGTKL